MSMPLAGYPRSAAERICLKPETSIHGERAGQSTRNRLGRFGVGRTAAADGCHRQEGRQRLRGRTEAQTTTQEAGSASVSTKSSCRRRDTSAPNDSADMLRPEGGGVGELATRCNWNVTEMVIVTIRIGDPIDTAPAL